MSNTTKNARKSFRPLTMEELEEPIGGYIPPPDGGGEDGNKPCLCSNSVWNGGNHWWMCCTTGKIKRTDPDDLTAYRYQNNCRIDPIVGDSC
jgi:hypothetical protein